MAESAPNAASVKNEPLSPIPPQSDDGRFTLAAGQDEIRIMSTTGNTNGNAKDAEGYNLWVTQNTTNNPGSLPIYIQSQTAVNPNAPVETLADNTDGNVMYALYQHAAMASQVNSQDGEGFCHTKPSPPNQTGKSERSNLPKKYKCAMCAYRTRYKSDLNRHVRKHAIATFNCDICNMPFKTAGNVEFHKRKEHSAVLGDSTETPKFRCKFCSYGTMYSSDLTRHVRKHGVARFHCTDCNRPFMTSGSLVHHKRAVHNMGDIEVVMGYDGIETVVDRNDDNYLDLYNVDYVGSSGMDLSMHGNLRSQDINGLLQQEEDKLRTGNVQTATESHIEQEGMEQGISQEDKICNVKDMADQNKTLSLEMRSIMSTGEVHNGVISVNDANKAVDSTGAHSVDDSQNKSTTSTSLNESGGSVISELLNGEDHLDEQSEITAPGKYKCEQCAYSTNYKTTFERHIKRHDFACHACDVCRMPFITLGHMLKHKKDSHSSQFLKPAAVEKPKNQKAKCPVCAFQTKDLCELRIHCQSNHRFPDAEQQPNIPSSPGRQSPRQGTQHSGTDRSPIHADQGQINYNNSSRMLAPWQQRSIKSEVEDGVSFQPPSVGRYAKLVSDFDDFSCRPFACALCFYRTGDVQSLARHAENHLTGCSVESVPQTARFSLSPFAHKVFPVTDNFTPHITDHHNSCGPQDTPRSIFSPDDQETNTTSCAVHELTRETRDSIMSKLKLQASGTAGSSSQASILEGMLQGLGYYRDGATSDLKQTVNPTFSVHYRKDHKNKLKPYLCLMCKKRFRHLTLMKQHFKLAHSDVSSKIYPCKVCSKIFHDPMSFQEHYEVNHFK